MFEKLCHKLNKLLSLQILSVWLAWGFTSLFLLKKLLCSFKPCIQKMCETPLQYFKLDLCDYLVSCSQSISPPGNLLNGGVYDALRCCLSGTGTVTFFQYHNIHIQTKPFHWFVAGAGKTTHTTCNPRSRLNLQWFLSCVPSFVCKSFQVLSRPKTNSTLSGTQMIPESLPKQAIHRTLNLWEWATVNIQTSGHNRKQPT